MAVSIRKNFYRLEQTGNNAFVVTGVFQKAILSTDVKDVVPVNSLGGADIGGVPYLYSKITLRQSGLDQELYSLGTVQTLQAELNA